MLVDYIYLKSDRIAVNCSNSLSKNDLIFKANQNQSNKLKVKAD